MINSVLFDNQIKIWWNYTRLEDGYSYRVIKDGEEFNTIQTHYAFKDLEAEKTYSFEVYLVGDDGNVIKEVGKAEFTTLKSKNTIDVTKPPYNAVGDGVTLNTKAIQKAIDDCTENDKVYFPDGTYLTGGLMLHSDVELRLSEGAVIQGTDNPEDYLPKIVTRFEGWKEVGYRSLLNAGEIDPDNKGYVCKNIVIYGGKIVGGGEKLRVNEIKAEIPNVLKEHGMEGVVNPGGYYTRHVPGRRRGRLMQFGNTQNILLADCFMGNGPAWNIHPVYCDNVTVCNCTVFSHAISNGDGINPDSTTNVLIFGIHFDTGDDFVAIKSGRNREGYEVGRPSKNITIFDCTSTDGHGIALGSEMSGGIDGVTAWNCEFLKSSVGISLKTNRARGGYIKNASFYNFKIRRLSLADYKGTNDDGDVAPYPPVVENIHLEDITIAGICRSTADADSGNRYSAGDAVRFRGGQEYRPKNITLKNITLLNRAILPFQNFIAKDIDNLSIENIICLGEDGDISPF